MALNITFYFAEIEPDTNMCISVESTSNSAQGTMPNWVSIPVYDEEYIFKYYNWDNGKFYYDEEYTEEYISPLL